MRGVPQEKKLQRKAVISPGVSSSDSLAPPIVHEVLRSPGQPLDAATRAYMEPRFGHDFSQVRVHTDSRAADSAQAVNAQAYTVGRDVVFGAGRYRPHNGEGQRLIAHELTHVMQQKSGDETPPSTIRRVEDFYEMGAQRMAKSITSSEATANLQRSGYQPVPMITRHSISAKVQRQLITPLAPGGGFGGLMDRDRNANTALNQSQYRVCARDLQGTAGVIANHAYVETPTNRYAVMGPFCGSGLDNVLTGTTAQKWDHSPDPCGQTPHCLPCNPLPGITDVGACLRDAFNAYNSPSLYNAPFGPNSNTFAGTLARRCCAGMNVKPTIFGNVPAWDNAPAPARAGKSPCPPGPTCGG